MSNNYVGETEQKRCARALLYSCVGHYICGNAEVTGDWVTLAGPEAREFKIMNALKVNGERIVMIDTDRAGVDMAQQLGARGFHGSMADCLYEMRRDRRSIAFVHFDFMGTTNAEVKRSMRRAAPLMRVGSVAAWTFLRGREFLGNPMWRDVQRRISGAEPGMDKRFMAIAAVDINKHRRNRDGERFTGYIDQMGEWLDGGATMDSFARAQEQMAYWQPLGCIAYDSGNSPMGIIVMKKTTHDFTDISPEKIKEWTSGFFYPKTLDVSRDYGGSVRRLALHMASAGPPDEAAAFIEATMDVRREQLAAWKAVETMKRKRKSA